MALSIIGIIVSLAALITLAYRGMPVILAAPIATIVLLIFSWEPILPAYTEIFMPALANFVKNYFPIFLVGAIFGVLMAATGYAKSIARSVTNVLGSRSAIAAVVITSALMTYGGISLFVVAFVVFPIAREIFRQAQIPRRLIPGTIALGIFTFTMTALPGSPQVQNIIPGQFFGTNVYAAPVVGLLGALAIFGFGVLWLEYRKHSLIKKGEGFEVPEHMRGTSILAGGSGAEVDEEQMSSVETEVLTPPNQFIPFLPLITVIVVNFLCTLVIFPAMDWSYLSDEKYGGATLDTRAGIWAVLVGIVVAILLIAALNTKNFSTVIESINRGMKESLLPIFSTSSEIGYGAVVASVAGFAVVRDAVFNLGANSLVTSVMTTSITAGITGSSSGGMTIALNALGEEFRAMAEADGTSMELMHRLTAMAAGGLDTLPHSGAVVTLLIVCGLNHRQGYKDIGMVTLVIPVLVVAAFLAFFSIFGAA